MAADGYHLEWLQAEHQGGGRAHVHALLKDLQQRHHIRGQRVLELGSGLGSNLRLLAEGNQVQGVEAIAAAAQAAAALGLPTLQADLEHETLPWADGSWDWVLMLDVLEHLVAPERLLQHAHRLLKPGGHVVVNVPNCFDWRCRWRLLRGAGIDSAHHFPDQPVWRYPHLRFFRHADLLALLQHTGLTPEEDLSGRQSSLPKARLWPRWAGRLSTRRPDLACSGFFVVARKTG